MKRVTSVSILILCLVSAVLAAQQKTGTLKGKIENEKGKPIAGAEVRVMSSRDRSVKETKTDDAGNYSFELEPDEYVVSFSAEGFNGGTLRAMQQVEAGKETRLKNIKLEKSKPTSLIRGAVFDSDGKSLPGARVKLMRVPDEETQKGDKHFESFTSDYVTNNRGEFSFRVPAMRARYQLTATLNGYKPDVKTIDVNESEAVPLAFSLQPVNKKSVDK